METEKVLTLLFGFTGKLDPPFASTQITRVAEFPVLDMIERLITLSERERRELAPEEGHLRQAEEDEGTQAKGADIQEDREEAEDFYGHRLPLPRGEEEEGGSGEAEEKAQAALI